MSEMIGTRIQGALEGGNEDQELDGKEEQEAILDKNASKHACTLFYCLLSVDSLGHLGD